MRFPAPLVRLTTWCAVIGYALVASGLPLPFGSRSVPRAGAGLDRAAARLLAGKDRSRPFPCMDKPCGCATADQCFTSCCCHTPAERLAWARVRGCEAVVRAALARAAAAPAAAAGSCCADDGGCCAAKPRPPEPVAAVGTGRAVSLRAMLACRGIVDQWLAAGSALPPPRVEPPRPLPGPQQVLCADISGASLRAVPDVPPPRAA